MEYCCSLCNITLHENVDVIITYGNFFCETFNVCKDCYKKVIKSNAPYNIRPFSRPYNRLTEEYYNPSITAEDCEILYSNGKFGTFFL